MRTLILGWPDERGFGECKVVCSPSVSVAEQTSIFEKAKRLHDYPKGIKRVALCKYEELETAEFIDHEVGKNLASINEAYRQAEEKKQADAAVLAKAKAVITTAENKVRDTAKKRNDLMGAKHAAEVKLRNAELGVRHNDTKESRALLDAAKKLLFGDAAEKIESLEKQVEAAKADYDKAISELNELKNPTKPKTTK